MTQLSNVLITDNSPIKTNYRWSKHPIIVSFLRQIYGLLESDFSRLLWPIHLPDWLCNSWFRNWLFDLASKMPNLIKQWRRLCNRDRPRFFDPVGHQTTKQWPHQAYQNNEPCQRSQNSKFKSHFSVSKIGQFFPKKRKPWRIFV